MTGSFLTKIDLFFCPLLPALSVLGFVLLGGLALPLPYFGIIAPSWGLIAVYYWAIYRPDLLRPFPVFLFGILNDFIHFLPLGMSAFLFVALYQFVFTQRRYFIKQPFFMLWAGFALVDFAAVFIGWTVMALVVWRTPPFLPILMQASMSLAVFPFFVWILIKLHHHFLSHEASDVS
ncbi:MAG: rod shape-determining protein MreD [Bdellovibrionales bacterium]